MKREDAGACHVKRGVKALRDGVYRIGHGRPLSVLWLVVIAAAATAWIIVPQQPAFAQSPAISVAPTINAEPASQTPLQIKVSPTDSLPRNSFLRVRGLPPITALSEGHAIAPGYWAIPLGALPELKINVPAGSTGKSEIQITLVSVDGTVLAQAKSVLVVAASPSGNQSQRNGPNPTMLRAGVPVNLPPQKSDNEPAPPAPPAAPSAAPSSASRLNPADRDRAVRFMKKGDEQIEEGNIAGARLLYQRSAEIGLAEAAMALAATYDATELSHRNVRGIQPDRAQARRWYERAQELGAGEAASAQLRRLGSN
jgi:hypothetical protein